MAGFATVQYRPTASELLAEIADLLENEVVPALSGPLQHRVRVAGNLARIVEREQRLGPDAAARELAALAGLLGVDDSLESLEALRAELNRRLTDDDDPGLEQQAWAALVAVARDDVAIAKPGHDAWEGQ